MPAKNNSTYQQKVISSYYNNIDGIMLDKLQELVSQLYLAPSEAKLKQLWDRAHKAMIQLKIKPAIIEHIMQKKDPAILAKNVADWLAFSTKGK